MKADKMADFVFIQYCRICGKEIKTSWGPETYSESACRLRDHLLTHSFADLQSFVLYVHLGKQT